MILNRSEPSGFFYLFYELRYFVFAQGKSSLIMFSLSKRLKKVIKTPLVKGFKPNEPSREKR